MKKVILISLEAFALIWLGACVAAEKAQVTSDTKPAINEEKPIAKRNPQSMDRKQQIEHAVAALASWKSVAEENIQVVETRSITWRSGALGCPKKGMNYTLALVPGRLIVLRVDDKSYRYHSDLEGAPFFCPDGRSESSKINPVDL